MFYKTVLFLAFTVICVSSECNQGCKQYLNRQYTRVKRGKYYSNPPIRFYNQPPMTIPIKGPFSYTPPPFMSDVEPSYSGSRPYKVSKRPLPTNTGLGDDDVTNLVKHLSKQDLDKILEFAQEKDESFNKYKDAYETNDFYRPYKRESKIVYKGNIHSKYEEPVSYTDESKFSNYVTESTPKYIKVSSSQDDIRPIRINSQARPSQRLPYETENFKMPRVPNDDDGYPSKQDYVISQTQAHFHMPSSHEAPFLKLFGAQESSRILDQSDNQRIPIEDERYSTSQISANSQGLLNFAASNNPYYSETNEEDKLPLPENMREEDYEVSYTNNVPKVVQSASYNIENFGNLPLMDYNSKLHDVSSYHVPHYTVTQPKPLKPAPPPAGFSSSSYSSSSTLLKPSPAAAAIKEPVYERAPSIAAAAEQSDAHLKAIKIWSHKSRGAAYTLHDDGSLTPERSRPKYG